MMGEHSRPGANPEGPRGADADRKIGFGAIVASIFAAAFGVQSSKTRERDFAQGNYRHFIVGGIIFTVLFVLTLVMVVRMVLSDA